MGNASSHRHRSGGALTVSVRGRRGDRCSDPPTPTPPHHHPPGHRLSPPHSHRAPRNGGDSPPPPPSSTSSSRDASSVSASAETAVDPRQHRRDSKKKTTRASFKLHVPRMHAKVGRRASEPPGAAAGSRPDDDRSDTLFGRRQGSQTSTLDSAASFNEDHDVFSGDECGDEQAKAAAGGGNNKGVVPNMFTWRYDGKKVYLLGSFNNWKRIRMRRSHDELSAVVNLPVGVHEYRFLVDGHWRLQDGHAPRGDRKTSVISVTAPDSDFLLALTEDAAEVERTKQELAHLHNNDHHQNQRQQHQPSHHPRPSSLHKHLDVARSPGGDHQQPSASAAAGARLSYQRQCSSASTDSTPVSGYGQEVPSYSDWDDAAPPPSLAPYLLQPLLNNRLPLAWHPDMLPEPTSHAVMRHMYVMAIHDGVVAMSATHRYRKKYITTLFYKPAEDEDC